MCMNFSMMGFLPLLYFFSLLVNAIQGKVIKLPIHDYYHIASADDYRAEPISPSQIPFHMGVVYNSPPRTPIGDVALIKYGLNITLGTPPQTLPVLLDINWHFPFVQSSSCPSPLCQRNHIGFDYSASSTYVADPRRSYMIYQGMFLNGTTSLDVLNIADISVPQQIFSRVDEVEWWGRGVPWYFGYDGVVGFGRKERNPNPVVKSVWENLVVTNSLDQNIFSLSPPTGKRDFEEPRTNGELVLGGFPEGFEEDKAIELELMGGRNWVYSWGSTFESVTFGDKEYTVPGGVKGLAGFSTSLDFIALPGNLSHTIIDIIGPTTPTGFFEAFPCEKRARLPDLVLGIGGKKVSLTGFQYSFELERKSVEMRECVVAFWGEDEFTVGLGWPFLDNFRTVFDEGRKRVLLEPIANKTETGNSLKREVDDAWPMEL